MGIRRVFVANRGEIALRVIRACHQLGIEAVLGASEADRDSRPAREADRVVCIGPARSAASYLNVGAVVTAAIGTGCDALHPGYGFLAERPDLAQACQENGVIFIGPSADVIHAMGNKLVALSHAEACQVPTLGSGQRIESETAAFRQAERLGFPVIVKAAAGGGGRGMRIVRAAGDFKEALATATMEARSAFGDETVYLERYVDNARHIEIQVLGDTQGHVIHLGERDCTIQRRHQKMIEEAPAYTVPVDVKEAMRESAVRLSAAIGYQGAGTVEFIYDPERQSYYFLEMNTRVQVEHPVTEMITGIDIVAQQIRVAEGQPLGISQSDVSFEGHAIECRIIAESPVDDFRPSPGRITAWRAPEGAHLRVDSHGETGYLVPPYYDSLLAKLVAHGKTRDEAIGTMRDALAGFVIEGIATNIEFLRAIIDSPEYASGAVYTRWVEERFLVSWQEGVRSHG